MAGMDWSKPIGPLPTGAWAAIVAAGVGLVWYTRTHGSSSSSTAPVDPTTLADSVGAGPTAFTAVDPTPQPTSNVASFTDNSSWSVAAIGWGIAHGLQPTIVDSAVRDYINGQNLSSQEQAIMDQILKALGPPPETLTPYQRPPSSTPPVTGGPPPPPPPPPVSKPPPVTSKPPVPTPSGRWFTVTPWPSRDSTLYGIAQDAYGNGNQWPTLFNANRVGVTLPDGSPGWISNPNLIYAGRKVWAPSG